MSRVIGLGLTLFNIVLASAASYVLWTGYGPAVAVQVVATLVIAAAGEHRVSGEGYYVYTEKNGILVGRVALWIPFMWVSVVQVSMILSLLVVTNEIVAAVSAGMLALIGDLAVVEPLFSRISGFWVWQPVRNGYFSFLPRGLDRFTAPPGNYVVWFLFPMLMNLLLVILSSV